MRAEEGEGCRHLGAGEGVVERVMWILQPPTAAVQERIGRLARTPVVDGLDAGMHGAEHLCEVVYVARIE
jgi:hypothetical protein